MRAWRSSEVYIGGSDILAWRTHGAERGQNRDIMAMVDLNGSASVCNRKPGPNAG